MTESAPVAVSVALCTHNGARFVADQLRSILEQQPPPDEVVVSDDASTDATVEVVRAEFGRSAPERVRLTVLENPAALGVSRNFEQALAACSGELIALSDQDDVWLPGRLSTAVARFEAEPELLLIHGDAILIDEHGSALGGLFDSLDATRWELGTIEAGRALDTLIRRNLVTGATTMIRRRLLELARPFDDAWVHDEWLAIIAASAGGVGVLRRPLIEYRQHGANVIGARKLNVGQKAGRLSRAASSPQCAAAGTGGAPRHQGRCARARAARARAGRGQAPARTDAVGAAARTRGQDPGSARRCDARPLPAVRARRHGCPP